MSEASDNEIKALRAVYDAVRRARAERNMPISGFYPEDAERAVQEVEELAKDVGRKVCNLRSEIERLEKQLAETRKQAEKDVAHWKLKLDQYVMGFYTCPGCKQITNERKEKPKTMADYALGDALVCSLEKTLDSYPDTFDGRKQAIHDLCFYQERLGLDPLVSEEACKLRDTHLPRVKELEEALQVLARQAYAGAMEEVRFTQESFSSSMSWKEAILPETKANPIAWKAIQWVNKNGID
jgi:hypothetical protein